MLILAGTPIGNLADASPRLISTLESARFIAAEDTRTLKALASHLGIKLQAELISLHEHNESEKLERLVNLAKNQDLVLVSDAGMPTISDPGFLLVRSCAEENLEIQVVPGPSAVISALAISGLPTDRFSFEGFLPRKSGERKKVFSELVSETRTQVFFESPHRIAESLAEAIEIYGPERKASISRELTKRFEETKRGTLAELKEWATDVKGELVLVISGAKKEQPEPEQLVPEVIGLMEQGLGLKQASGQVAKTHGVSASRLYDLALKSK